MVKPIEYRTKSEPLTDEGRYWARWHMDEEDEIQTVDVVAHASLRVYLIGDGEPQSIEDFDWFGLVQEIREG